jgi:tetratricopeptide (TPR) repeat protein
VRGDIPGAGRPKFIRHNHFPILISSSDVALKQLSWRRENSEFALAQLHIPETLQDSLMARLDRAPRLREVAQLGSVLGREFAYDMISALAGIEEDLLQSGLGQLVVDELLYQRGRPPRSRYLFKHALIQDAAYQSLLKRTRQQYHQQAAKLLEDRFPEVASTQPALVAHHYTEANCPAPAIAYWYKAGAAAASKSANLEAIDQYRSGLALVEALSDAGERAEREVDLQMALGPALFATRLSSHPDIGRTYARAWELCRQLGDHPREFTALRGLQLHHQNLLEMEKAQHFAEEALRVAERLGDPVRLVGGQVALGVTLFPQGKLEPALAHFRRGFELFDPNMQFPDWPGSHPGVQCQFHPALISWMLGYPDLSTGAEGSGKKRRGAWAPVHPRPNAVLGCARSHLSPRAVGGRGLCRTGFADLRGAPHRELAGVCPLRGWGGALRLRRKREGAGPNQTRGRRLRSWGAPTHSVGVAGRCAIGDRQARSGA